MSYQFRHSKTFSSFPGLKTQLDGIYPTEVLAGNKVKSVIEQSPYNYVYSSTFGSRQPEWLDSKFIRFLGDGSTSRQLLLPNIKLNFLHNGQPFGMYGIGKWRFDPSGAAVTPFATTESIGTGIQCLLQPNLVGGRFSFTVRSSGTIIRTCNLANMLTPGNANELPFPNVYTWSHIFTGANITNNQRVRVHNLETLTTDTSLISEYANTDHLSNAFISSTANNLDYYDNGLLLIYDWTGFTEAQVLAFDTSIRAMLDTKKPLYL